MTQPTQESTPAEQTCGDDARRCRGRAVTAGILVAAAIAVCGLYGFAKMFSEFKAYDDEGAMLIVLDQLNQGHKLYDQVVTMYGPMGWLPKLAIVKALNLTVNHDTGRMMTLVLWMLISGISGAAVGRWTRSTAWGCVAFIAVCFDLSAMNAEPGHPQDMCGLLIALAALTASFSDRMKPAKTLRILAILGGLLAMTKINLGAYYAAAMGATLLVAMPRGTWRSSLMAPLAITLAGGPWILMFANLDQDWAQRYAIQNSLASIACLIAAAAAAKAAAGDSPPPQVRWRQWIVCAACFIAAMAGVCILTLAVGTSPRGLWEGVIALPMKVVNLFVIQLQHNEASSIIAAASLALAIAISKLLSQPGHSSPRRISAILAGPRILLGAVDLYLMFTNDLWHAMAFQPALAWLIVAPAPRSGGNAMLGRWFLAFAAVTESLWAYPVAGTQLPFSLLPVNVIAVISMSDGFGDLAVLAASSRFSHRIGRYGSLAAIVVSLSFAALLACNQLNDYANNPPLRLPGSDWMRISADKTARYRLLCENLRQNGDIFYTMPGVNSLYFWTQTAPPTPANPTQWMFILSDQQQREVIAALEKHPRACVLYFQKLVNFWRQKAAIPAGPLMRYLDENFQPACGFDDAVLSVRKGRTDVVQIMPDGTRHPIPVLPPTRPESD